MTAKSDRVEVSLSQFKNDIAHAMAQIGIDDRTSIANRLGKIEQQISEIYEEIDATLQLIHEVAKQVKDCDKR
jgi:enamine deaminase RidA (YjgF/YER057c/UK114 family)